MATARELLEQAERLQRQTNARTTNQRVQDEHSVSARTSKELGVVLRFLRQLWVSLCVVWRWAAPVRRAIRFVGYRFWRGYLWLWNRVTHTKTSVGVPVFSPVRGGLMAIATAVSIYFLIFPMMELVLFDAPMYLFTARMNEVMYLKGSQEIDASISTHAIKGCHKVPCDDADAVYFRVENDLISNFWSLIHGRGLFYPEYVAAAVPNETQKCVISDFGVRLRGTARFMNYFPQLLAVSCYGPLVPLKD